MKELTSQEMQSVRGGEETCYPDPFFGEICCFYDAVWKTWVCYFGDLA